jgi:hypothetical protein
MLAIPDGRRQRACRGEKTIMTGSHRCVVARVLTAPALLTALSTAGGRPRRQKAPIIPGDSITGVSLTASGPF